MLHRAAVVVEDRVQAVLTRALLKAGRPARVEPFPGFAVDGVLRIRGRVLLNAAPLPRPPQATDTRRALRANLAQFTTLELPYAQVRVEAGGRDVLVVADREGNVNAELSGLTLEPGRHVATLTPVQPPGESVQGVYRAVDPRADVAVVSDIDDTIVDSGVARGLLAMLTTVLLRDGASRVPLEGAPELYQALARGPEPSGAQRPFFYLSTSPWNLAGFLQGFLQRHGFPDGPLLLTDWGPGSWGLFRIRTRVHKLEALRLLARTLPGSRFVLVGDSGQEDADIYTAFVRDDPGRVLAVYIRRAGFVRPRQSERLHRCAAVLTEAGVPFLLADDSAAMLRHAQSLGLAAT